jgi:hypothetical protein
MGKDDIIFIMAGTIPNRKSAPVVSDTPALNGIR